MTTASNNKAWRTLSLADVPLQGHVLIEASAGTGKTYTITGLVLRAVLGLACERALSVQEILVVTFTKAATAELRSRIRARLKQAYDVLKQPQDSPAWKSDEALAQLLIPFVQEAESHKQAQQRLMVALLHMDEASIYTIHSFCQQVLQQYAFESGSYFDVKLSADETDLRNQAAVTAWRALFYRSEAALQSWGSKQYISPDKLLKKLEPLLARPAPLYNSEGTRYEQDANPQDLRAKLDLLLKQAEKSYQKLQRQWQIEGERISKLLLESDKLNRRSYTKNVIARVLQQAPLYWQDEEQYLSLPVDFSRLTQSAISKAKKKSGELQDDFFMLCEVHKNQIEAFEECFLLTAYTQIKQALEEIKQQQKQMGFDDLLQNMQQSLLAPQGQVLADNIRQQYPLALIDEFQDTDQCQYDIFSNCYPADKPEKQELKPKNYGLLMIGDPKQAIYQFRGADIHVYLKARANVANDQCYTLHKNYRSSQVLLQQLNALFLSRSEPLGPDIDMDYVPVESADQGELVLQIDGEEFNGLKCNLIRTIEPDSNEKPVSSPEALELAAIKTCDDIASLLKLSRQGKAHLLDKNTRRAVRNQDIAVLVNTNVQAEVIQKTLKSYGLDSVFLNRNNIFSTDEARLMRYFMQACLQADQPQALRALLASALLGASVSDLLLIDQDSDLWQLHSGRFQHYRQTWGESGFMLMWMQFMQDYQVAANILKLGEGARSLTNLLHLAELLQAASIGLHGKQALLIWLAEHCEQSTESLQEEQQLRLETDAELIQITTVHSAKGLEYPVVFLPFVGRSKDLKVPLPLRHFDPIQQQSVWRFGPKDELHTYHKQLEDEHLAEQLRLLYVALTRAVYSCHLYVLETKNFRKSALAYLLGLNEQKAITAADIETKLQSLQEKGITRYSLFDANMVYDLENFSSKKHAGIDLGMDKTPKVPTQYSARTFTDSIDDSWRVSSYSGLTRYTHSSTAALEQYVDETYDDSGQKLEPDETTPAGIFTFQKGANAGNFFHYVFEHLDFGRPETAHRLIEKALPLYGLPQLEGDGLSSIDWVLLISKHYQALLQQTLQPMSFCLADIQRAHRVDEMAFFLPLKNIKAGLLSDYFSHYRHRYFDLDSKVVLNFNEMQGLLKGFIDLSFSHEGRYYIADYKSNHLGYLPGDYHQQAMQMEMLKHLYDVQLLIYTVAMHRYLKIRLDNYDYEQHFGGAFYLFIRGMTAENETSGVFFHKPDISEVEALEQLLCPPGEV